MGWASRLSRVPSSAAARSETPSTGPAFLPVRVSTRNGGAADSRRVQVEIALAGGRTVRVSGGLAIEQLVVLLDAIEGRGRC